MRPADVQAIGRELAIRWEDGSGSGCLKTVCDYVHLNPERAKGDPGKVAVAVRLRRETTMTLKWVAQRLAMGSWRHVSNLLAAVQKQAR